MKKSLFLLVIIAAFCTCKKANSDMADSVTGTYYGQERDVYSDYSSTGDSLRSDTTYLRSVVVKKVAKDSISIISSFNWHGLDTIFTHSMYLDGDNFSYDGNRFGFFSGDSMIIQVNWGTTSALRDVEWMNVFNGKK